MNAQKKKPSLAELQRWMRWIITEPRGIRQALSSPWTIDPTLTNRYKEPARQLALIEEAAPLSTQDRLDVYANAYFYRLLESLAVDYKTVQRVLGEETFHNVVAHYLMRYPSKSPNVGDLGEAFPEFIKGFPLPASFSFVPELATLERAIMESIFTSHLPALDVHALQTKSEDDWATARFVLDPAVRLMSVQWPVDTLWKSREQPEPLELPGPLAQAPRHLLLYRDDLRAYALMDDGLAPKKKWSLGSWVTVSALDVHPWMALQMLQSGMSLGAVCDALSKQRTQESESLPVMEWFSSWVAAGLVRNILWDN